MSSDMWIDKQGNKWHITLHDPVSLAQTSERRLAVRWTLTLTDASGRCKELFVELGNTLFELLGLATPRRQSEFRECLLGATRQALFLGRLGDSETVVVHGSPDNVLRLYYTPRDCPVSELATAQFGFEQDECYEAELVSYVRAAILKALRPRQLSGVAYPDLLEAAGIEEDVFERVLDGMIADGLVSREQLDGASPELFRIAAAEIVDASATVTRLARSPVDSRTRSEQSGSDARPSLDVLIDRLKRDDEHLDIEAKEAFFANTRHRDAVSGSPQPNTPEALADMLKTLVAFANTFGGCLIVGLKDKTWEPVGIDGTDIVLCGSWEQFKRKFTRRVSDKTEGIVPSPEIRREKRGQRTIAIIEVQQLPRSSFQERDLACLKRDNLPYVRANGDSVVLQKSERGRHCDAMLKLSYQHKALGTDAPLKQQIRDVLDYINPLIVRQLDAGAPGLCVMINDIKLPVLIRLSKYAVFGDYIGFEPTGCKSFGSHNTIGGYLNDVADVGELTGFRLVFKPALRNLEGGE